MNVLESQPILEKFDVDITLFTVWLLQPRPNKQIIYTVSSSMIKSTICLPSKADFVSPCSSRCLPITEYLCSLMRWCKCQVMCINTIKTITNLLHQSVCSVWLAQNNNLLEICCFNVKTSEVFICCSITDLHRILSCGLGWSSCAAAVRLKAPMLHRDSHIMWSPQLQISHIIKKCW